MGRVARRRRRTTSVSVVITIPAPTEFEPAGYDGVVYADGPAWYLPMQETTGTTADDFIGSVNGTYQGTPTLGVAGPSGAGGTAVLLNGTSQYVSVPDDGVLDVGDGPVTYELWYKRLNGTKKSGALMAKGAGAPILLIDDAVNGQIEWYGRSVALAVKSSTVFTDTNWHHIVGTKSAADVWLLYVDGVDVTTPDGGATPSTTNNTTELNIGRDNGSTPGSYLAGSVCRAAIYKSVLTPSQIATHHAVGLDVTPPTGTQVAAVPGALAAAVAAATSGDTLILRGGTHSLSGQITTTKALTIVAWPGETPNVTWNAGVRNNGLYFQGSTGARVVRGITFTATSTITHDSNGSAMVESDGCNNLTLDGCTFIGNASYDDHQQLVYQRYGTNILVTDCVFDANGSLGFGFHQYPGVPTDPVCRVENSTFTGFNPGNAGAITTDSRITVDNCGFYNNDRAVQLRNDADNSIITNNYGTGNTVELELNGCTGVTDSGNTWT